MHGEAKLLLKFLDGSDNRYIIPVYQRNYDWRPKQCEQLFMTLFKSLRRTARLTFLAVLLLLRQIKVENLTIL